MKPITVYSFCPVKNTYQDVINSLEIEKIHSFDFPFTTTDLKEHIRQCDTPYMLYCTSASPVRFSTGACERMLQVARSTGAAMIYSDYIKEKQGVKFLNPVIEYQEGSLRDDFNFGSVILYRTDILKRAAREMEHCYRYACMYDLRLRISRLGEIIRIPETLYTETEDSKSSFEEKQFEYVNPKNRDRQIEMEHACTGYLKSAGAWIPSPSRRIQPEAELFPVEATVVIPVKNRIKTIADAIHSALSQETDFSFNIIVVDNHSTDGTTNMIDTLAMSNPRLIHHMPAATDLGIGGCWTEAIMHKACGKFAVQLDSDDLYINTTVLQCIIDVFRNEKTAMVIGSYKMVNFKLEEIPPGIIDHREWTEENGHNNALRINGFGAPRAFYTPVLRELKFPNVSYGEDYAVCLAISRSYRVGRIYEPLYLCRRWDENSDANLDINKFNNFNFYKDKIRTIELMARKQIHSKTC